MHPADVAAVSEESVNKNETFSGRAERRDVRTGERKRRILRARELLGATFAPPTPLSLPQPPYRTRYAVGVADPLPSFLPLGGGQFRLPAGEEASGGSRCHGNRRKASPGIVRNNYPALNSARSRALRISSLSHERRAGSQIVYADKNSPTTTPGVASSSSIANCF